MMESWTINLCVFLPKQCTFPLLLYLVKSVTLSRGQMEKFRNDKGFTALLNLNPYTQDHNTSLHITLYFWYGKTSNLVSTNVDWLVTISNIKLLKQLKNGQKFWKCSFLFSRVCDLEVTVTGHWLQSRWFSGVVKVFGKIWSYIERVFVLTFWKTWLFNTFSCRHSKWID